MTTVHLQKNEKLMWGVDIIKDVPRIICSSELLSQN